MIALARCHALRQSPTPAAHGMGHPRWRVLPNPHVDVCLTAPSNLEELDANLAALDRGPLDGPDADIVRQFGALVHPQKG